jgi:4-alpha-glucanotransferase
VAGRIALALAIHNHQPVGNFGWVFEDVFRHAYEPLLDALERHPGVHLSLHYTGPLIEWIRGEHPAFLDRLRALVEREQVEVLGGGYYEPVLVSLPDRDRHGQLVRMADEVERLVGRRPRGAWLAERVWEPQLPSVLADAGYEWTILDDNHFRAAAIAEDAMWGAYVTEDQGRLVRIFGTERGLRYRIPFGTPEAVIDHLRTHATEDGHRLGMMGDDGEKFGAWPGTYDHCWGDNQWIERFFGLLEEHAAWLTTVTPSAWLELEPPLGRAYVPAASYQEMGEWALPPADSNTLTALVKRADDANLPERRFLRGGFWRNFQVRYREINDLHKQMLRASAKVAAMSDGAEKKAALDHLYRGQSNDCYWHGLFGGIYIVHMRLATCAHLIAAEDLADEGRLRDDQPGLLAGGAPGAVGEQALEAGMAGGGVAWIAEAGRHAQGGTPPPVGSALLDTDMDGVPEAYLASAGQILVIDLAEGAAIGTWDLRATRLALASVMRRRPEAYHAMLAEYEGAPPPRGDDAAREVNPGPSGTGVPTTIHDMIAIKEPGLSRLLVYDRHERRSALLHVVPRGTDSEAFRRQDAEELGDVVDDPYRVASLAEDVLMAERDGTAAGQPVLVRKTFRLAGGRLDPSLGVEVEIEHRGHAPISADVVLEWNVDLAGGGGNPAAYYAVPTNNGSTAIGDDAGPRVRAEPGAESGAGVRRYTHDSAERAGVLASVSFGNSFEGADLRATLTPPADVGWYPVETVSNSEAGFERQYQGSCLLLRWPLALEPGASAAFHVQFEVMSSRDHRAEER